jgi:mannose-1-phosphate guanylyltransferase
VYVLTRPAYADRVREHAGDVEVLTEPAGKDTGPALVYAAAVLRERAPGAALLCLPSDHHVGDPDRFAAVARRALAVARDADRLVTLGVEPTRPATEYGYLKPGAEHEGYYEVETFREKPDPGAAARYLEQGYLWNAGVFAWRPEVLLEAARESPLAPIVEAADGGAPGAGYDAVDPVSVDHAVLERAGNVAVVPADLEWDDLGSWDALARISEPDADGNVVRGDGEALLLDVEDCVVAAGEGTDVSVVGTSGLTVAAYDGRVLVVPTRDAQRVREVVARLGEEGRYPEEDESGDPDG